MFGRNHQDPKVPTPPATAAAPAATPSPPTPAPPPAPTTAASTTHESVIGDDLAIIGEQITVISRSRLRINGTIQGNVNGQEIIVGPKGRVVGTVTANEIRIEGQIDGALRGSAVTLAPSARVDGDIYHQKLAISEGAQFDGRVRRPNDVSEITPNLDPSLINTNGSGS